MKVSSFAKYLLAVAIVVGLFTGCSALFTVEIPITNVKVVNSMYGLTIGGRYTVKFIDVYGLQVGSVPFGSLKAGSSTAYAESDRSGNVQIYLDSAIATLDDNTIIAFKDMYNLGLSYTITSGQDNVITLGRVEAETIFEPIVAKRLTPL